MEKVKPVLWTDRAFKDLSKIFDFLIKNHDEVSAHNQITAIVERVEVLENAEYEFSKIGAIDDSFLHLKRNYRKLLEGNYKITYREGRSTIYIIRVFDTRRNPNKNR